MDEDEEDNMLLWRRNVPNWHSDDGGSGSFEDIRCQDLGLRLSCRAQHVDVSAKSTNEVY